MFILDRYNEMYKMYWKFIKFLLFEYIQYFSNMYLRCSVTVFQPTNSCMIRITIVANDDVSFYQQGLYVYTPF